MKRAAVIGAGLGGLSSAIYLAKLGFDVEVFEKNEKPGGKLNSHIAQGYTFELGPTLLTMPFVLEELFGFAGKDIRQYLKLRKIDPICRNWFTKNSYIDSSPDMDKMSRQIEKISSKDARNLPRFLDYSKSIYENSADVFLYEPFQEILKMIRQKRLPSPFTFMKIDSFGRMYESISNFFESDEMRKIFARFATYNGSNPFVAPATLNIIAHVEMAMGSYYVEGGISAIASALEKLGGELGISINYEAGAEEITYHAGKADGVRVNGVEANYDYIVCNADVIYAHEKLIQGFENHRRKLRKLEPSLSGMLFLWGVEKQHPELQLHNVFFSDDYRNEFETIFTDRKPPSDPTVYVSVSSKAENTHAPEGAENWYVLLNMPYNTGVIDWKGESRRLRQIVLEKLAAFGFDIENYIGYEKVITPEDMEKMYFSNKGSIYGISSNSRRSAFLRPANRSRILENLYFAGGSSHPGGGVPLALLSGRHCADLIAYKEGIEFRSLVN